MDTLRKEEIKNLKSLIKSNSVKVRSLKKDRASKRGYEQSLAMSQCFYLKMELRHMYIAYALLRFKTIDDVEPNRKTQYNQSVVDKYLNGGSTQTNMGNDHNCPIY